MFVQVLKTCPAMHFRNMDVLSLNNYEYTKKEKVPLFFSNSITTVNIDFLVQNFQVSAHAMQLSSFYCCFTQKGSKQRSKKIILFINPFFVIFSKSMLKYLFYLLCNVSQMNCSNLLSIFE